MATIEEIIGLEGDSRRSSQEVQRLLQEIRQEMQDAQQADRQTLKNIEATGKTGLKALKTRKDFLLAKRAMPELSFKDFLLNDKTSAEYMRQGVKNIVDKTRKPITLKETLGFDKYRFQGNPLETKKEFDEKMKIAPINTIQEEMVSDQPLEKLEYADYEDAEYIPMAKPKPTLEEIMQGVKPPQTIFEQKMDLQNNLLTKPTNNQIFEAEGVLPEGVNRLNASTASQAQIDEAMAAASSRMGNTSTAVDSASTGSNALGTAGTALGAVSALKDLGTKGLTPTTALDSIGTGLQLTGVGALPGTILKGISSLIKGTTKYN
tara:strand:- start:6682 stop:7641 length:960 start_codon:yes stop_codon:yes gene_type:complete